MTRGAAGGVRVCLTVAGSDPTGGAGVQMDLRMFSALGVYGTCAVTAVTVQTTRRVARVLPVPGPLLRMQMEAALSEFAVRAVKIGMLATPENVRAAAGVLRAQSPLTVVLDSVLYSSGGRRLLDPRGRSPFVADIFPLVTVVTANLREAGVVSGVTVTDTHSMKEAAGRLRRMGPRYVVIKGGHLAGDPDDLLYDGRTFTVLHGRRIRGEFHGLGCALSSAIAAFLARGMGVPEAVRRAKDVLERALAGSLRPRGGRRVVTLVRSRSGYIP